MKNLFTAAALSLIAASAATANGIDMGYLPGSDLALDVATFEGTTGTKVTIAAGDLLTAPELALAGLDANDKIEVSSFNHDDQSFVSAN